MTNYKKIKTLIEAGFMVSAKINKKYIIASSMTSKGDVRLSTAFDTIKKCYDFLGGASIKKADVNKLKFKDIEPLPLVERKILKGRVDIMDCPEIRQKAKRLSWPGRYKSMIGKKNLKVVSEREQDSHTYYRILHHNPKRGENNIYVFPARFVSPSLEEKKMIKIDGEKHDKADVKDSIAYLKAIN